MPQYHNIASICRLLCVTVCLPLVSSSLDWHTTQYAKRGFAAPIKVFSTAEIAELRELYERIESQQPRGRFPAQMHNLHLTDAEVWRWVRHPSLASAVENVAGFAPGTLLILMSTFVTKYAPDAYAIPHGRFGWHQDVLYWDISSNTSLASWIAIDEVTEKSGGMKMIAGRHVGVELPHMYRPEADNLLLSKKEVVDFNESDAVSIELMPGEMSVHDGWTPHGSGPNTTPHRRAGLVINWMPKDAVLQPSREGYGALKDGALIEEFRLPVDRFDQSFPPRVLQRPEVHVRWRRCKDHKD